MVMRTEEEIRLLINPRPGSRDIIFDRDADVEIDPLSLGDEAPFFVWKEKRKNREKGKDGDSVSVAKEERGRERIKTNMMPTIAPLRSGSIASCVTVCAIILSLNTPPTITTPSTFHFFSKNGLKAMSAHDLLSHSLHLQNKFRAFGHNIQTHKKH